MMYFLDIHTFIYFHSSERTTELVKVNLWNIQFSTKFPKTDFNIANLKVVAWSQQ